MLNSKQAGQDMFHKIRDRVTKSEFEADFTTLPTALRKVEQYPILQCKYRERWAVAFSQLTFYVPSWTTIRVKGDHIACITCAFCLTILR